MTHKSKSWTRIKNLGKIKKDLDLAKLFKKDDTRGRSFNASIADLELDFSKSIISKKALLEFEKLAKELNLQSKIFDLLQGKIANNTEKRSVGHVWLRSKNFRPKSILGVSEIDAVQTSFLDFSDKVRAGVIKGFTGEHFTDVVNIGIGGSDLGPAMVYQALGYSHDGKIKCHYVSNIDELEISTVLRKLNPAKTLIVVTSKTFTTSETLKNAAYAKNWLVQSLGDIATKFHFVAISANSRESQKFGIEPDKIFPFWDWVGGRFSLLSSVGISIALGYGSEVFTALQKGASKVDQTLTNIDYKTNAAFIHAVINIWNLNILKLNSLAVIPYSSALSRFPAYLQQLWMESNGKSVDKQGRAVKLATCPIIFGEPGTNSQHSFFQLLHQGTNVIPVEFIIVKENQGRDSLFHKSLIANALAQSFVLAFGKSKKELKEEKTVDDLISHKEMKGNRPSMILTIPKVDAVNLGGLIAFYETSVIIQGLLLNINSFDQWGVELGKKTAEKMLNALQNDEKLDFDSGTNNQIKGFRN